jgi:cation:H+ antiporter
MIEALGFLALGLLLLALGGDSAVKGVSGLAQRLGLRPFTAGLLVMAFATSLPELAVNLRAIYLGHNHLALGNAVGSSLANLGLTLGVAALAAPLLQRARLHLPLLVLLAVACLALMAFGLDGAIQRWEGLVLLAGFVAVVALLLRQGRAEPEPVRQELTAFAQTRTDLALNLLRLAIAVAVLHFGARWVVAGGLGLGQAWGLSPLLVGLLPVAIGSALPEVAAAVIAARRGQGDVVAGHVLGSSLFNLLVIVGGMAAFQPLALPASFVRLELPALVVLALVLYPMLRSGRQVSRGEGAVLVAAFAGWGVLELLLV